MVETGRAGRVEYGLKRREERTAAPGQRQVKNETRVARPVRQKVFESVGVPVLRRYDREEEPHEVSGGQPASMF